MHAGALLGAVLPVTSTSRDKRVDLGALPSADTQESAVCAEEQMDEWTGRWFFLPAAVRCRRSAASFTPHL